MINYPLAHHLKDDSRMVALVAPSHAKKSRGKPLARDTRVDFVSYDE